MAWMEFSPLFSIHERQSPKCKVYRANSCLNQSDVITESVPVRRGR